MNTKQRKMICVVGLCQLACIMLMAGQLQAESKGKTPVLELPAKNCWVDDGGAHRAGKFVKGWTSTKAKIRWKVKLVKPGRLDIALQLAAPGRLGGAKVQAELAGQKTSVATKSTKSWKDFATQPLGQVTITKAGEFVLTVQALQKKSTYVGDLQGVVLSGPAAEGAKLIPVCTRADSIHLRFMNRLPKITQYYNEIEVKQTHEATFFMACGFHRGYFGMQDIRPGKKVVIFSVWDPKSTMAADIQDPRKVKQKERVVLLYRGEGVRAGRFGGEGTGGQSFYDYDWKVGQKCRFLLEATPLFDEKATIYTGYFYLPQKKAWKKLASFKIRGKAEYLRGTHSFLEDWRGHAAHKYPRSALYGPAWAKTADGKWTELTKVGCTQAGKLKNVNFGVVDNRFLMATGADTKDTTGGKRRFTCKPTGKRPEVKLPKEPVSNVK